MLGLNSCASTLKVLLGAGTLYEALYVATPPLGTNTGALRSKLDGGGTGFYFLDLFPVLDCFPSSVFCFAGRDPSALLYYVPDFLESLIFCAKSE